MRGHTTLTHFVSRKNFFSEGNAVSNGLLLGTDPMVSSINKYFFVKFSYIFYINVGIITLPAGPIGAKPAQSLPPKLVRPVGTYRAFHEIKSLMENREINHMIYP
jgi:hypothetical protein